MSDLPAPLLGQEIKLSREISSGCEITLYDIWRNEYGFYHDPEVFKARISLLFYAWSQRPAGSIENDPLSLRAFAGLRTRKRKWDRIQTEALAGWVLCSDNRWYHPPSCERAVAIWNSYYARPPAQIWRALRSQVFERDGYRCVYCGEKSSKLQCDHVVPVARGGIATPDNLVTACAPCNRLKRDRTVADFLSLREKTLLAGGVAN